MIVTRGRGRRQAEASKAFLDSIAQTVRLIRSKGGGVFFVTQTPVSWATASSTRRSASYRRYAQAVDGESADERLEASRGAKGPDGMREASVVEQVVGSGMFGTARRRR
ncbi:hypothetical protein AQJ67_43210 [Streptomyces caeruleatus]|uniref:Helicase HerA-like C-terminal domain-containing protein n=1 Tax=Streptomyces caeruleatus TaxID=661399 RepID=A0A101TEN6_9ACTN|nr:hypothetical protein AQJ67_43210 [Streptomyces caeruleatus]